MIQKQYTPSQKELTHGKADESKVAGLFTQVQNYARRDPMSTELHKCRDELRQESSPLHLAVMAYLAKKTQEIVDE